MRCVPSTNLHLQKYAETFILIKNSNNSLELIQSQYVNSNRIHRRLFPEMNGIILRLISRTNVHRVLDTNWLPSFCSVMQFDDIMTIHGSLVRENEAWFWWQPGSRSLFDHKSQILCNWLKNSLVTAVYWEKQDNHQQGMGFTQRSLVLTLLQVTILQHFTGYAMFYTGNNR